MMLLPSESTTSWEAMVGAALAALGAGGALKLYTQWQAGKASIRAETSTRIRSLEETVGALQTQMGNLREENGSLKARVAYCESHHVSPPVVQ